MALIGGSRLGPYEIVGAIGAGGMGEVYRARDARLHRDVAIKFLPIELTTDHERLARFEREARILASLNHPNVGGIHGLIDAEGIDVFLEEPPAADHPLMVFDNVILTPHNAGSTRESHANVAIYASEQWIDIFDGKVPPRLINKAAWPKYSERFQKILGFKPVASG